MPHSNREFMEVLKYLITGTEVAQLLRFLIKRKCFGVGFRGTFAKRQWAQCEVQIPSHIITVRSEPAKAKRRNKR